MRAETRPVLLRPDNFTPTSRTPWGGDRIVARLKRDAIGRDRAVGESWEVSVEPDFPSTTVDGDSLDAIVRADPVRWLGTSYPRAPSTELLVKLLDAKDDLSVQIHPTDDYEKLAAAQGGKPETWYVVDADEGACIYLGLGEGVDEAALRSAVSNGGNVASLLVRVPVSPGDFFVIAPGTPHAIGRGCLLVEPQRVTPGRRGVTYRFWDWNRRYDSAGRVDPSGTPRSLHVEHAIAVTDFGRPRGDAYLALVHRAAGVPSLDGAAIRTALCSPTGPLVSNDLTVDRLEGTGAVELESGLFHGLVVLEGSVRIGDGDGLVVERGRSAAIPAGATFTLELDRAHAILAAVP